MTYFATGLKTKIIAGLGLCPLLLSGCTDRMIGDDDGIGGGDSSEGSEGTSGASAEGTTTPSVTTATTTSTSSSTTTVGSEDDGPQDTGHVQMCFPSDSFLEQELYLPRTDDPDCTCNELCQEQALALWEENNGGGSCWYWFGQVLCAEALGDQCHYVTEMFEEGCGKGRPLFIDDRARTAPAAVRGDWATPGLAPRQAGLSPEARRALAESYTAAALAEHASVASFARFALDLAALGAPPELLTAASEAMQDEVRHAELCFALAAAYGDAPVGPGPLPLAGLVAGQSAEAIVRAAVREGCVEETLAAAEAELASHRATDPAVRAALTEIAEDEARHAVLAWRLVGWAVRRDRSLVAAVRQELERATAALDELELPALPHGLEPDVACAHGVVPPDLRRHLRERCLHQTVRPCANALLAALGAPSPSETPRSTPRPLDS